MYFKILFTQEKMDTRQVILFSVAELTGTDYMYIKFIVLGRIMRQTQSFINRVLSGSVFFAVLYGHVIYIIT